MNQNIIFSFSLKWKRYKLQFCTNKQLCAKSNISSIYGVYQQHKLSLNQNKTTNQQKLIFKGSFNSICAFDLSAFKNRFHQSCQNYLTLWFRSDVVFLFFFFSFDQVFFESWEMFFAYINALDAIKTNC